ncbi:hypothetical protein MKW94_013520 [Papaver nudicaule]|uniref:rRNA-processing protein EFG1 n=1 Tax=Papaver nudicaule TaxID=74823 RepID=A0AA41V9F5_PAPNU|nr:hypothetical protein [Papaver nudicaule]
MVHGGNVKGKAAAMNHVKKKNSIGIVKNITKKPSAVEKKTKTVSYKNQIRSTERILRKTDLPPEVRQAQEKKLEDIKKKQELLVQLAENRVTILKNKKPKFFERRKLDRGIKKLERVLETASDETRAGIKDQLAKLKEDLEYVKFFPKSEKYLPLFSGGNDPDVVERRNVFRQQIKANILDAAASGRDLEETEDAEDDFFLNGSSSDEAEAGDESTQRSSRKQAPSSKKEVSIAPKKQFPRDSGLVGIIGKKHPKSFGNAAFDKNQKRKSIQAVEPASRPSKSSFRSSNYTEKSQNWKSTKAVEPASRPSKSSFRSPNYSETSQSKGTFRSANFSENSHKRFEFSSNNKVPIERVPVSASINKSQGGSFFSSKKDHQFQNTTRKESSNNLNTNPEAPHKPKRKRRPKKKKT